MKSIHLLVLGLVFGEFAFGEFNESSIKVNFAGQGRLRFEQSDRTDYLSLRSAFLLRIRPEIKLSKDSGLSLFVQPQFVKALGRPEFTGVSTSANSSQNTSGVAYDTALSVHQAFIEYPLFESLRFTVGRQLLSYGNEVVLSGLDWDNTGRSFDAIKARYSHDRGSLDLFYAKLFAASVTATRIGAGDNDLVGLYLSNNLGEGLEAADFYFLYREDFTSGSKKHLFAIGIRAQSKVGDLDYRAEVTKEFGSSLSDSTLAQQVDFEMGWTFTAPFKSRLGFELFHAGADYDQLYPLAHKYLGIADVFGRRNLQGGVLHLNTSPTDEFSAQFDLHYLLRASTNAPAYKLSGTSALGTGANTSPHVGTELDLILTYVIAKDLSAVLGGAVLFPGDYLKTEMGDLNPTFWYTQFIAQL